jgi:hypothetical protein
MSSDQNAGQNGKIQTGNNSFETVEHFKYLGTARMNQNSIHEDIKSRLKSRVLAIIPCGIFGLPDCYQKCKD